VRVELHFHLLPGVDDGPGDAEGAVALARDAAADGTGLVVATPHAGFVDVRTLVGRVAAVRRLLLTQRIPLAVRPGAELLAGDVLRLDAHELGLVAHGPHGRRWVLLEAPLAGALGAIPDALEKLRGLRYGVLIAHPERCPGWWSAGALDRVLDAGARLQVNASSLLGAHGRDAEHRARALIRDGRATALSSDAHGPTRPPCLAAAVQVLARVGIRGEALVSDGPTALLVDGLPPLVDTTLGAVPT
jgi:protein-tyrosine phosphatase